MINNTMPCNLQVSVRKTVAALCLVSTVECAWMSATNKKRSMLTAKDNSV